ncbi:MAG: undecaprenyl-diphosphate phosphatase [Candidatus Eisenbacteria bacterium]|uniref:Undecaprenyl-diphosphatase n=1 Tax=Eiseniibacteriota bacterium TaxID=2212470 RepID=A0A849T0S8_UNCEI|nr:undecaprenyl-diphosphate phosphatase [Candidatus Eisenbacteria bacterium]
MTPVQAAILGIVQGLTEFLPVSSSAHLFAVPALFGWPYAGLAFDVALHWGTLLALLVAFRDEWRRLFAGAFSKQPDERGAAWTTLAQLALGCVPAAIAGLLLEDLATTHLRALPVQAVMLVVFGFLLWWVDRVAGPGRPTAPGWAQSFLIGLAQSLALVPGVSRSGVTLTAGRALGLSRLSAARFSFLLATPITFGAGVLELRHLDHSIPLGTLGIGVGAAALTGFLAIRGLLAWLSRAGLFAFFAYRVAFAVLLIVFALRGR